MKLDRRLHAYRDDLADESLRGRVDAPRFVQGVVQQVAAPVANVHRAPDNTSAIDTQALMGEVVSVFAVHGSWAWVQLRRDGYVGYVRHDCLNATVHQCTHRVTVPSTLIFPKADLKSQPVMPLSLNAEIDVISRDADYLQLSRGGFVYAAHACAMDAFAPDHVAVAEQFLNLPYLWGGKGNGGLDCSGLVQVSMHATGRECPRDTDLQEAVLGTTVSLADAQRGDLVFWKGHVGMTWDEATLLHANGHHMMVVKEPLRDAVARSAAKGSAVTSVKRIQ